MMFMLAVLLNLGFITACQETTPCSCPPTPKPKPTTPRPAPPTVPVIECVQRPVDIALLIDSTVSIGSNENYRLGIEFIKDFLNKFDISPTKTRVAAVQFGHRVFGESAIPFGKYSNKRDTLNAISNFKWELGNRTETGEGIDYIVNNFLPQMRRNVAQVGIILTDGQSQDSEKTKIAAEKARAKGLTLIVVGVGRLPNYKDEVANGILNITELNNIAGPGRENNVLIVGEYSKLNSITEKLFDRYCYGTVKRDLPDGQV
ncbi:hypothetical protein Btru_053873 [Bulinus truncatus]|nr:hypothetical protein Btru_053873 [Bulinus truncatus]